MGKRPFGVSVLSIVAFLLSPGFVILALRAIWVLLNKDKNQLSELASAAALILLASELLLLSWISYVAGDDLWNLRPRGKDIAIAAAMILFLYGAGVYFISGVLGQIPARDAMRSLGAEICSVGAVCMLYLFLPSVKAKFRPNPS